MQTTPFSPLHPEAVLNCVEQASGRRLLNVCRPHSSYINRVYELQDEDGEFVIVKFFRPGRWSEMALLDELQFVNDCAEIEIPVIRPMPLADGSFLGDYQFVLRCILAVAAGWSMNIMMNSGWNWAGSWAGCITSVLPGPQREETGCTRNRQPAHKLILSSRTAWFQRP